MMAVMNFERLLGWSLLCVLCCVGCKRQSDNEVVYTTADGKKSRNIKAVSVADTNVPYQVVGGKPIPEEAKRLHQEARTKGEAGEYDEALALLEQAARLAPEWAYPPYDMAFTYLLKGETATALQKYLEADKLEPRGFFTTKTAVWSLKKEQAGEFPSGTYLTYVSLEWTAPAKKRVVLEKMTAQIPKFTPAWKDRMLLAENEEDRGMLLTKALGLESDVETHGILMLNQAALLHRLGQREQALRLTADLQTNASSTLHTKEMAGEMEKLFKKVE